MTKLNGKQYQQLTDALLAAFPRPEQLKKMLRVRLDKRLNRIVGGHSYETKVDNLVEYAEAQGWVLKLVAAAREHNPGNPDLFTVAQQFGLASTNKTDRQLQSLLSPPKGFILDLIKWRTDLAKLEYQVCQIKIPLHDSDHPGGGTGFLIGPSFLMTNYHVVEAIIEADRRKKRGQPWAEPGDVILRFDYKLSADGITLRKGNEHPLADDWLLDSSPTSILDINPQPDQDPRLDELDYAILRIADAPGAGHVGEQEGFDPDEIRGWIDLADTSEPYRFQADEIVSILQHPMDKPLWLAFDDLVEVNNNRTRVTYKTNTRRGSSGAPCFNINWELIAIHNSGSGDRDEVPNNQPRYNQGIPISTILGQLKPKVKKELGL